MTATEMYDYFVLLYDINGSQAAAGFTQDEVYSFLSKAQEELVKELFQSSGTTRLRELFTTHEETLAVDNTWRLGLAYKLATDISALSDVFWFYIGSKTHLTRTAMPEILSDEWINNELITETIAEKYQVTTYNVGIFKNPKVLMKEDQFIVMVDSYTIPNTSTPGFHLDYIKRPLEIGTNDCELNEELHRLLVENAVELALNITWDERIRTKNINIQTGNVQ